MKALVDDEDYDYLNQWKWSLLPNRKNVYAVRGKKVNGKHKTILMHNEILKHNSKNKEIDHIDRNGLNNQRNNLRIVTHSENLHNSRDRRFNKKIGLKKKNNIWVVYLINKEIITDICYFDRQDMALKNIKENKKRYLETV
ncbi:HNH endonuclease [bacterium]|nr:HNH endonuclease [bacterium]